MTSSFPSPQGSQRSFNSALLERTFIAIPLLEQIQQEAVMIEWALKNRPGWFSSFDCAILLNQAYPGGIEAAYEEAAELVREAEKRFPDDKQDSEIAPAQKVDKYTFVVASLSNRIRRKILCPLSMMSSSISISTITPVATRRMIG
jgi:hypothetical protein